jgi:hypothetical protein
MAILTATEVHNYVGTCEVAPAALSNVGPTVADIGAGGVGKLLRIFDVTVTSTAGGDTLTIVTPDSIKSLSGGTLALGLDISVTPMTATAITGNPFVSQFPTQVVLTFAAAAVGAVYRVKIDGRHSIGR